MQSRLREFNGEPYTRRLVSTVRGQVPENLPLKGGKALDTEPTLVSRLIYTVGYDGKRYNEEYDSEGNKNRMLSNLLRRYKNEIFPSVIANNYMVVS